MILRDADSARNEIGKCMPTEFSRKLKRGTKVLISSAFLAGDAIWGGARRLLGKKPHPSWTILYYHSIASEQRSLFAKQMDLLLRFTIPVSVTDRCSTTTRAKRYSSITFDDAFETVIDNAIPELRKRGIPATIFVTSKVLGQPASWWSEDAPEARHRIMSAEQVRKLPTDLISIGSHTLTHPMLTSLSEREARLELSASKAELEELLGREVPLFSFPFSAFNGQLVEWCRQVGYNHIFAGQTVPSSAIANQKSVLRGRIGVEPTDWTLEFCLKALGAYRWLPYAVSLKRTILSNGLVRSACVLLLGAAATDKPVR
jgi:peptidoglycan/xylan/chitin deacetylase (PgdA/CDA1 family)